MSVEPLKFLAEIAPTDCALQFGDDGARIEIWSKPIQADFAQAAQLVGWTRKLLFLSFFMPKEEVAWVEFVASIAPLGSAIRFTKDSRVKVKFDIPETEKLSAARLAGMAERVFRLEVAMRGDKQASEAKPKGEHGRFWKEFRMSSAPQSLDFQEWLGLDEYRNTGALASPEQVWLGLRAKFNTESLTFVSPETAIQAFEQANLHGVATIARRLAK